MEFEAAHSFDENEFYLRMGENLDYPLHVHRSFECFTQISGTNEIQIDGVTYTLNAGESVMIFPFQTHSYSAKTSEEHHKLYIFSPGLVSGFYNRVKDKLPTDNRFSYRLTQDIILENHLHNKALAYFLCGEFDIGRKYVRKSAEFKEGYFEKLLLYVNQNFNKKCSLKDATEHIGYDYAYISKKFKNRTGMTFNSYVNSLRISEAKRLLQTTSGNVGDISEQCGFSSFRSFSRDFRNVTGITPSEYRNRKNTAN